MSETAHPAGDPLWRGRRGWRAESVWRTLTRYPLAIVFALALTLYGARHLIADETLYAELPRLTGWALACGYLWVIIATLWARANARSWSEFALALVVGLAVLALVMAAGDALNTMPSLILIIELLVLTFAAYPGRKARNAMFWAYNQRLWLGAGIALSVGAVVAIIATLTLLTTCYLLAIGLDDGTLLRVFVLTLGSVAALSWLTLLPERFDVIPRWRARAGAGRGVALVTLASFLALPLISILTLVLVRYAFDVWRLGTLPDGRLGWVLVSFIGAGLAFYLLCYPLRERGHRWLNAFWRGWFVITLVPIGLLGVAVYVRIQAYGLTEARYLLALVTVWLGALAMLYTFTRVRDLRLVPASLAALLMVGAVGPLGAAELSLRSQRAILGDLLQDKGLLRKGRIIERAEGSVTLGPAAERRLRSGLTFFTSRKALDWLRPWFAQTRDDPFVRFQGPGGARLRAAAIARAFHVPLSPVGTRARRAVVFFAAEPTLIPGQTLLRIAGPITLSLPPSGERQQIIIGAGTGRDLVVSLDQRVLMVTDRRGRRALFDLAAVARTIPWFENRARVEPAVTRPRVISPRTEPTGQRLAVKLAMTAMQAQRSREGAYSVKQIAGWLLLERARP